jgi:hypothetical protein
MRDCLETATVGLYDFFQLVLGSEETASKRK